MCIKEKILNYASDLPTIGEVMCTYSGHKQSCAAIQGMMPETADITTL